VDDTEKSFARRGHVADEVFEHLAGAILRGELAPGSALPPERVLAERYGVSRIIARQGVHRLAEMALVRVRQGGATVVLDPHEATDLRVLALFYRFAPRSGSRGAHSRADVADMIEKQYLQGLSIVEVASRRASAAELRAVRELVERVSSAPAELARFADFEEGFWRMLAVAGKNRIFRMEVGWWYEALPERPVARAVAAATPAVRIGFYRELARRLAEHETPTEYYLAIVRPILDAQTGRVHTARRAKKNAR
jgi:GntR family transcriptional regulator, transcriptional repressor for pyruvate dehydrogenase complex